MNVQGFFGFGVEDLGFRVLHVWPLVLKVQTFRLQAFFPSHIFNPAGTNFFLGSCSHPTKAVFEVYRLSPAKQRKSLKPKA